MQCVVKQPQWDAPRSAGRKVKQPQFDAPCSYKEEGRCWKALCPLTRRGSERQAARISLWCTNMTANRFSTGEHEGMVNSRNDRKGRGRYQLWAMASWDGQPRDCESRENPRDVSLTVAMGSLTVLSTSTPLTVRKC